ncbi:N-acetylserotonin O-methyltransferase-like protein [Tribolium castaneum]|uniref:N-acetylserotonin O-methyltransferase-like protein n=1 Tax=Tribolium castaneum TaxID=7070 RepID=D6WP02_TRICA|nr:PREDICTED: maf-like protein CLL_A0561 [Tribolium castaneum]EFA04414.1 N-acetylserotonin O-methyltransferase-like protein [Tribolium castaneum]|eukprot:XP_974830.1 PREDICTED: maf-like protein CLL_A0561 [Tribolium castaneum]
MLEPLVSKLNDLRVILASGSEQRAALLKSTRLNFEVVPSNFEENLDPKEHTFSDFVEKTALGKVNDVWERLKNDERKPDIIIGADTMVTFNGRMYGKPKTKEQAIKTITDLTHSPHIPNSVYTGVVVRYKNEIRKFTEVTTVYMAKLSPEEILAYVETGEPMGKAGGYGIQGMASTFVDRIEGDGNNVIGLPMSRLAKLLKQIILNQF